MMQNRKQNPSVEEYRDRIDLLLRDCRQALKNPRSKTEVLYEAGRLSTLLLLQHNPRDRQILSYYVHKAMERLKEREGKS